MTRIVGQLGTGGGVVASVAGILPIVVDNTDPANPIVSSPELYNGLLNDLLGDGSFGPIIQPAGTMVLTRDTNASSIVLSGTGAIDTAGFELRCNGDCDLTAAQVGAIFRTGGVNGGNGVATGAGGTAGAQTVTADGMTIPGIGIGGTAGGAGGVAAGVQAAAVAALARAGGGNTGAGAKGGTGSGGVGGASRAATPLVRWGASLIHTLRVNWLNAGFSAATGSPLNINGGQGGPGGGGGGGDGTSGAGGGGGGSGGAILSLAARRILVSGATPVGVIRVLAGNGGTGGTPAAGNRGGGGGGTGAGGGVARVVVVDGIVGGPVVDAIVCDGGNGGNGGNGAGTGTGGDGGSGGAGGQIYFANLSTGVVQTILGTAGPAGGAAVGVTGGLGAVGQTCRVSL